MFVSYKKHHKKTSNLKRNQIPSSEIIDFMNKIVYFNNRMSYSAKNIELCL